MARPVISPATTAESAMQRNSLWPFSDMGKSLYGAYRGPYCERSRERIPYQII